MAVDQGVLSTLVAMLKAAPSLQGVAVTFGEEMIAAQDQTLPWINIVPGQGQFSDGTGYAQALDVNNDMVWILRETHEIWMWAFSQVANAQPVDHADTAENLRAEVLQALWSQAATGLRFVPVSGRWEQDRNSVTRYGRAYVMTVQVDVSITDVAVVEALPPITVTLTPPT